MGVSNEKRCKYVNYKKFFNPYSVMKPPGGFLDFLKITYLFIIY